MVFRAEGITHRNLHVESRVGKSYLLPGRTSDAVNTPTLGDAEMVQAKPKDTITTWDTETVQIMVQGCFAKYGDHPGYYHRFNRSSRKQSQVSSE